MTESRQTENRKNRLPSNKWYALGLLMVIGLFNYIDRLSISILQVPIKAELGLSDSQIDALTGLAFSLGTLLGFGASGWLGEAFGWRLLSQDLEAMESGSARPTPRPTNPKPEEAGF